MIMITLPKYTHEYYTRQKWRVHHLMWMRMNRIRLCCCQQGRRVFLECPLFHHAQRLHSSSWLRIIQVDIMHVSACPSACLYVDHCNTLSHIFKLRERDAISHPDQRRRRSCVLYCCTWPQQFILHSILLTLHSNNNNNSRFILNNSAHPLAS